MGKASRRRTAERDSLTPGRVPRRVRAGASSVPFVARPFAGLPGETDWVALREIVPAATAQVRMARALESAPTRTPTPGEPAEAAGSAGTVEPPSAVTVATVLPMAWAALRRVDGDVLVGLQSSGSSGDISRDLAAALTAALEAEPGAAVPTVPPVTADSPRLQDVLDAGHPFEVTVHEGFDFWVSDTGTLDEEAAASLERANATVIPTTRLSSVESAYWCRIGERTHLRWVLSHDEDAATDALARLHAAGASGLDIGSRLLGAFRACGLLVPVWDLDPQRAADSYERPVADFAVRLGQALAAGPELTGDERRARAGLLNRQITLR